ncbi:hypothetical protein [Bradyrhizobium sp. CCBAU 11361]|uniref:hypothetical protein n=1 Tax=Bradyrhizobium sp. CCBAU 11361 TaxID=1630812 RepID=UPI002304433B|nr:hypothetical protein [Bradyrhizobium sp. CCBAU 11361]
MTGFVGIYPNANDQTNRVIAALDKIIEDYDNCIASSCGSVGRSRSALRLGSPSSSACARIAEPSHVRKLTSTYSMNVIPP